MIVRAVPKLINKLIAGVNKYDTNMHYVLYSFFHFLQRNLVRRRHRRHHLLANDHYVVHA